MIDFFFFLKTMLLTLIVVLLLQIQIGDKTIETHMHDMIKGSVAAGFLDHAAHGGAHFLRDATHQLSEKMRANIGMKRKYGADETKASRFHWWGNDSKASSNSDEDTSDAD